MSDLDDFDLDDFEFDDGDLDFPDLDDPDRIPTKREAIVNTAAAAAEGLRDSLVSTASVEDMISRSMPDGYSQALGIKDVTVSAIRQIKNDTAEDFKPLTAGLKHGVRKILPRVESKLPKWFVDRLEEFSEPERTYETDDVSQDQRISEEIASIFKANAEKDNEQRSEEKAERLIRDRVEETKFESTIAQLSTIARGVGRLVGFNEDVQVAISKKSLEIQLKSFYMFKNYADIMTTRSAASQTSLGEIVKNTALPDVIKIQKSELAGRMLSERIIGGGLESLSQFSSNYVSQLSKNVSSSIKGMMQGGGGGLDEMRGMYESLEDMDPAQRNEVLARMGGGMLGDELRIAGSNKLRPHMEKMDWVQKSSNWFKHNLTDWQSKLDTFAKSSTDDFGFKGQLTQALKDILPKYYMDEGLRNDNLLSGDKASYFDNTTHRSINQVIPSLLVSSNRWLQMLATGKWVDDEDTEVYNITRGQMTTKSRANKDLSERIVDRSTRISVGDRIDTLIKSTVGDHELSGEANDVLRKQFVEMALRNERFDPKKLAESYSYPSDTPVTVRDELADFFRTKYFLEIDGEIIDGKEDEHRRLTTPGIVALRDLKDTMPTTASTVRALVDTYGIDSVKQTGFVRQAGNKNIINREHIVSQLLAGADDINEVDTTIEEETPQSIGRFKSPKVSAPKEGQLPYKVFREMNTALQHIDKSTDNIFKRLTNIKVDVVADTPTTDTERTCECLDILTQIKDDTGKHLFDILDQLKTNGSILHVSMSGLFENFDAKGKFDRGAEFTKDKIGKGKALFNRGYDFAKSSVKNIFNAYGSVFSTAYSTAGAIGKTAKESAISNYKKYTNRADVYVRGERTPRLYAQLMEQELYHDALTLKAIKSIDDIKGPVLDDDGNYVLTQEDIDKGLHTSLGTSILSGLTSGAFKLAKGYVNLSMLPYKLVIDGAKKAWEWTKGKVNEINDVYIRGEKTPRLLARLLEQGDHYYDTVLKRYINDPREIKGDILDVYGNLVLSFEEIQRNGGLFKRDGESIFAGATGFAKGLLNKAKVPLKMYKDAVVGAYRFAKDMVVGAGKWLLGKIPISGGLTLTGEFESDMLRIGHGQLSVQERILQVLMEMRADQIKDPHDKSGDGFRDGSWQEQRAEAGEGDAVSKAEAKAKKDALRKGVTWSSVGGGAMSAIDKFRKRRQEKKEAAAEKAKRDEEGGLTTGNAAADGAIGAGVVGTVWGGVKTVGKRAGGFLAEHSKSLGRIVWDGAKKHRGVAIGATVISGGWYLLSRDKKKRSYLTELRIVQYGADLDEEDQVALVGNLERLFVPAIVISGDTASIDGGKVNMQQLFSVLGMKTTGNEAIDAYSIKHTLDYLTRRFQPVLLKHYSAWKKLVGQGSFQELDRNIPFSKGLEYIKMVGTADDYISFYTLDTRLTAGSWAERRAIGRAEDHFKEKVKEFKDNDQVTTSAKETIYKANQVRIEAQAAMEAKRVKAADLQKSFATGGKRQVLDTKTGKMVEIKPDTVTIKAESVMKKLKQDSDIKRYNAIRSTRYYTYGLSSLNADRFESLYKLEEIVYRYVAFTGRPTFTGEIDTIIQESATHFGTSAMSDAKLSEFTTWLTKRFIPTFLEFCYEVRRVVPYSILMADKLLKANNALHVARGTVSARYKSEKSYVSVWTVTESPWKEKSNTDKESVKPFLDDLNAQLISYIKPKHVIVIKDKEVAVPNTYKRKDTNEPVKVSEPRIPKPTATLPGKSNVSYNLKGAGVDGQSTLSYGRGGATFGQPNAPTFAPSGGPVPTVTGGGSGDYTAVPQATGNGWDAVKDNIVSAANVVGFDPGTAATMAGVESSLRPDVVNSIGAAGLFQIVPSTWKDLMGKYAAEYGIPKGTPATDHSANSILGIRYLKDNHKSLERQKDTVSDVDLYLSHFLGPTGARKFLKASDQAIATDYVSTAAARNNKDIFYKYGRAVTVGEVKRGLDAKLEEWRQRHGLATLGPGVTMSQDPLPKPVDYDNDVLAGVQERPTGAVTQPQEQIAYTGPMAAMPPATPDRQAANELLMEQGEFTAPAKGDIMDGSGASSYLQANGNNLDGLNPEFKKNLFGMIEEYGVTTGKPVQINAAFRSYQEQAMLKAKYGPKAATPGRSLHEFGLAADLNTVTLNEMEKLGLMKKYGFTRPVGGETWHIEPAGIQGDIEGFKRNPQAAAAATAASLGRGGGGIGIDPNARKYSRNTERATAAFNAGPSLSGTSGPSLATFAPQEPVPTPAMSPTGERIVTPPTGGGNESESSSLIILEKQLSIQTSSHALFEQMVSILGGISEIPTMQQMPNVEDNRSAVKEMHVNRTAPMETLPVSNVRRRSV